MYERAAHGIDCSEIIYVAMQSDPRIARLVHLIDAPAGAGRIALAMFMGVLCHAIFMVAVLAMIWAMFFGLSQSFGQVPWPWAILANAALIVQFPLLHSLLLTGPGGRWLARLVPGRHGAPWPPPPMR